MPVDSRRLRRRRTSGDGASQSASVCDGKEFEIEATELLGRCLQHEIDHLHGKLFIDYLSVLKRRAALAEVGKREGQVSGVHSH